MATRLDLVLEKHPEDEEGVRLLAARDPSGNLKYLDWAGKMLASGQALAPEIADILDLDLFHLYAGRWVGDRRGGKRVYPDIHTYRPQDLADLRGLLVKIKLATDRKRRKRERLYRSRVLMFQRLAVRARKAIDKKIAETQKKKTATREKRRLQKKR